MLKNKDIIDEKDNRLRTISKEVELPLSQEDRKHIDEMIEYLTNSQIEELAEKYNLRPGMGLSAIQLGIPKRYFVVVNEYDEGKFENYIIINPKIVSTSAEKIYVELGEGNKIRVRGREEVAIAFQHEMDHLNGILFYDHIDKNNPYKDQDKYRAI